VLLSNNLFWGFSVAIPWLFAYIRPSFTFSSGHFQEMWSISADRCRSAQDFGVYLVLFTRWSLQFLRIGATLLATRSRNNWLPPVVSAWSSAWGRKRCGFVAIFPALADS